MLKWLCVECKQKVVSFWKETIVPDKKVIFWFIAIGVLVWMFGKGV
jgi:hypothetical protein